MDSASPSARSPAAARASGRVAAFLRANRTAVLITLASFVLSAWMPLVNRSRTGDMSDWHGDHLHHPFATWIALHKGTAIYTQQFQAVWEGSGYPHEYRSWGEMPGMAYPPGVFALFLPTTFIGKYVEMSLHAFGVLNLLWMLVLAHLSILAVLLALKELPEGSRASMGVLTWTFLASMGLEGFYDPVFVGAGAMCVRAVARRRPGEALVWLGVGALLHFRMAAFAPVGLWAVFEIGKGLRKGQRPPWGALAFVTVAGVVCVWSFLLMYPTTEYFRTHAPVVLAGQAKQVAVVLSLVVAAAVFWFGEWLSAAMVLICLQLALVEQQPYWWHQAIMLAPMVSVGAVGKPRNASVARAALIPWFITLSYLTWRDGPFQLFVAFTRGFKT